MHIIINEGPNRKISTMRGNQLTVSNREAAVAIKVSTPNNNNYTGLLHLSLAEVDWLIRELPGIRNASKGVSVFLDKDDNKIPLQAITEVLAKIIPTSLPVV